MWDLASRPRWIWPSEARLSYSPAGRVTPLLLFRLPLMRTTSFSGSVSAPRDGSGLYPDSVRLVGLSVSGYGIRIRIQEGKNDPLKYNKFRNFMFEVLDVLFWGLKAASVAIMIKKINFVFTCNSILIGSESGFGSVPVFSLKCWIRIRIKCVWYLRIRNTGLMVWGREEMLAVVLPEVDSEHHVSELYPDHTSRCPLPRSFSPGTIFVNFLLATPEMYYRRFLEKNWTPFP